MRCDEVVKKLMPGTNLLWYKGMRSEKDCLGKRNKDLNTKTIKLAGEILKFESKNAQWIAAHALRELTAPKINILGYPR
jgi:hypothetical protein